jgi:hypothetical protein
MGKDSNCAIFEEGLTIDEIAAFRSRDDPQAFKLQTVSIDNWLP